MNQAEAHRRRLLIAGAAGLSDTTSFMEEAASVPTVDETAEMSTFGGAHIVAQTGSPASGTIDLSLE